MQGELLAERGQHPVEGLARVEYVGHAVGIEVGESGTGDDAAEQLEYVGGRVEQYPLPSRYVEDVVVPPVLGRLALHHAVGTFGYAREARGVVAPWQFEGDAGDEQVAAGIVGADQGAGGVGGEVAAKQVYGRHGSGAHWWCGARREDAGRRGGWKGRGARRPHPNPSPEGRGYAPPLASLLEMPGAMDTPPFGGGAGGGVKNPAPACAETGMKYNPKKPSANVRFFSGATPDNCRRTAPLRGAWSYPQSGNTLKINGL